MSNKKIIIFIFLIALASGFFWNQKIFGQPATSDQSFYDQVAQNILGGSGFTYYGRDAGVEPFYPLFLAGIYKVFGHNYDTVRIIQIFLFAFLVVFIYLIADLCGLVADKRGLIKNNLAFWSTIAVALFPGLAIEAGNAATEILFTFLLIVSVFTFYQASLKNSNLWLFSAGIFLALSAMTKSIVQFFIVLAALNVLFIYYQRALFKKGTLKAAILLLAFLAALSPWYLYNRYGEITIAPRIGGGLASRVERMERFYSDYAGHFIGRLFGYYFSEKLGIKASYDDYRNVVVTDKTVNELVKSGKNDIEIDQQLTAGALKTILKEPHKYIAISLLDFISFNSPILPRDNQWRNTLEIHPMFAEGRHPEIPDWKKTGIIIGIRGIWFLFLFLAICGAVKIARNWAASGWLILIVLYFNLAYSAIHAIPRYALPIYPFYILLAVVGLAAIFKLNEGILHSR